MVNPVRIMKEHYDDQMEIDAVDMVWSLFGTAVHSILKTSQNAPIDQTIITEEIIYKCKWLEIIRCY